MGESCIDFAQSLSCLLCDPVFYGTDIVRGDNRPVLLIPGFFAGDWSLLTMARWLMRIGYRPYLSGIDWNVGCPDEKSGRLGWRLAHITDECGMPAVVLGHSLGGMLARALAVKYPARVTNVVTLGSPARLEWEAVRPRYRPAIRAFQSVWHAFNNLPPECGTDQCTCRFGEAVSSRIPRGIRLSSLYTREDEVVDTLDDTVAAPAVTSPRADLKKVIADKIAQFGREKFYASIRQILLQTQHGRE